MKRMEGAAPVIVEIAAAEIENVKNIEQGKIDFQLDRRVGANVVGVYGQNGSGKTALLDAIAILREALTGQQLSVQASEKVSVGVDRSHLAWTFNLLESNEEDTSMKVTYSFDIVRPSGENDNSPYDHSSQPGTGHIPCYIENEVMRVSRKDGNNVVTRRLVDTTSGAAFGPDKQFNALTGSGMQARAKLRELRDHTRERGQSFVFSQEFQQLIADRGRDVVAVDVLSCLRSFGTSSLHVVVGRHANLPAFSTQPIIYLQDGTRNGGTASSCLPLSGPAYVSPEMYERLTKRLQDIDHVRGRIVPGHKIGLLKRRSVQEADHGELYEVEVASYRDGQAFPFRYESAGIRKLVTIFGAARAGVCKTWGDPCSR